METESFTLINSIVALCKQVVNSPASLLVIVGLNVVGYLFDIWPKFPSAAIPLAMIIGGPAAYPFFAHRESVPKEFPYPIAVLIVNGLIAGFVAVLIHKQLIQRFFVPKPQNTQKETQ